MRLKGAKWPGAGWSKSLETPIGWHLSTMDPSDWVAKRWSSLLCLHIFVQLLF